jgi:hypothetical protein
MVASPARGLGHSGVPPGRGGRLARGGGVAALALALTCGQVLVACLLSGQDGPRQAYLRLYQWDSRWYGSIVEQGYLKTPLYDDQSNPNFFPGYPVLGWLLQAALGLELPYALLLAAQLSCWAFWAYVLLLLRRWRVPPAAAALAVLPILCHPAAFFLVAAYSEPLFLAAVLGFLFWWPDGPRRLSAPLAALHGLVMTATRLVGLPLVVYPLFQAWLNRPRAGAAGAGRPQWSAFVPLAVGAAAGLGLLLYFAYLQFRLGAWDLFLKSAFVERALRPDYLCLFTRRAFQVRFPGAWRGGYVQPDFLDRLSVPLTLAFFGALFLAEWRLARPGGWRARAGLYLCAGLLFYVPACAQSNANMISMIRYALGVHVLLVLAAAHLVAPLWARWGPLARGGLALAATGLSLASLVAQLALTYRFTHGGWVA